jgi:hypothetical protein
MAMTLSRLITRSAMATILIARNKVSTGSTSVALPFSSEPSSLTAIHNSSTPPTSFRYAICISVVTNPANMIRKVIATTVPRTTPQMRWWGGSLRHASAITTALSPDSSTSIQMICKTASQKPGSSTTMKLLAPLSPWECS